jgi:hypothetical protein
MAALVIGTLLVAGCGAFRREPIDVPPGQQVVLGEIYLRGFNTASWILDITREGGTFDQTLSVDAGRSPFAITLPPGRYLIKRLHLNEMGRTGPETTDYYFTVTFDVGDQAVYVGTLQIERVTFLGQVRVTVQDDFESSIPEIRARHPGLPSEITRSLARPG